MICVFNKYFNFNYSNACLSPFALKFLFLFQTKTAKDCKVRDTDEPNNSKLQIHHMDLKTMEIDFIGFHFSIVNAYRRIVLSEVGETLTTINYISYNIISFLISYIMSSLSLIIIYD